MRRAKMQFKTSTVSFCFFRPVSCEQERLHVPLLRWPVKMTITPEENAALQKAYEQQCQERYARYKKVEK